MGVIWDTAGGCGQRDRKPLVVLVVGTCTEWVDLRKANHPTGNPEAFTFPNGRVPVFPVRLMGRDVWFF